MKNIRNHRFAMIKEKELEGVLEEEGIKLVSALLPTALMNKEKKTLFEIERPKQN
ncbi:MAG: hypothetical protein N2746_05890 [Deltaproteobacteria bacterium]|nr:hypothetical protein [Deltaproteobacteria bacterium]